MGRDICKWMFSFLFSLNIIIVFAGKSLEESSKVRGVNLGGWLVVEGWIKPSLFDGITDKDLLDGTKVQFQSLSLGKFISAESGGGQSVVVNRDVASTWETFKLWRVTDKKYQLRTDNGQFLTAENGGGSNVSANVKNPGDWETFYIIRHHKHHNLVHIRAFNGMYLQAVSKEQLTADYRGNPGWHDNAATFLMNMSANDLHGDYQLANGYGQDKAKEVYDRHRNEFIIEEDFKFLAQNGINTVRIPVGWWIAYDPTPPSPFIGGSLAALDNAFKWSQTQGLKVIIDLHAAPGSQNGMEHSASRDGSADWANSSSYISQTLEVIDFLASRYGDNPMLLGIELLNEPLVTTVPIDVLYSYYAIGYQLVRKHTSKCYVIICQRIGNADPHELYQINGVSSGLVVDVHYYSLFDDYFNAKTAQENINFIVKQRQREVESLDTANGPLVFVGEWTNEWKVKGASKEDYQRYGDAQLQAYGKASFGWSYWTLKNAKKHWDFEWNIKNHYLDLGIQSSANRNAGSSRIIPRHHIRLLVLLLGAIHWASIIL